MPNNSWLPEEQMDRTALDYKPQLNGALMGID